MAELGGGIVGENVSDDCVSGKDWLYDRESGWDEMLRENVTYGMLIKGSPVIFV